jgi:hypothetical protein
MLNKASEREKELLDSTYIYLKNLTLQKENMLGESQIYIKY